MRIPGGRMFAQRNACGKGTKLGACLWSGRSSREASLAGVEGVMGK